MLVAVGTDMLSLRKPIFALIAVFCSAVFLAGPALAQEKSIIVASTTSTKDSGLFEHLLPLFTLKTGIAVKVRALGTGQALDVARRGDADVVFVHAKLVEQTFVAEGHGVKRYPVMYNDFVLIGPESDPAGIRGEKDVAKALRAIKDKPASFISRGDNSGTHQFELMLWNKDVGINIQELDGPWYKSVERGMKATLHMARATDGYALSDRGTWISFKNKGDLKLLVEGDRRMFNQYGVILVNPDKHPKVQKELGQTFIDWLISADGQQAIAEYKVDGRQLFFPNATDPNA
jgi:tungstate transport system substrate-binding protein